jgi:hypothetical protein
MIQHILLWNYRDDVGSEERERLEEELVGLVGRVPSVVSLKYGPVVGGRNQSFEHCFVMLFDDMAGLSEYATHPAHVAFAGPFKAACSVQVVADFEVVNE